MAAVVVLPPLKMVFRDFVGLVVDCAKPLFLFVIMIVFFLFFF
jgi:hypothetical protein